MILQQLFDIIPMDNINYHYWNRYKKFIIKLYNRNYKLEGYIEHHHIIPRCVNKTLEKEPINIIKLTAREHYIAHLILSKCFNNEIKYKLYFALSMFMTRNNDQIKLNSKQYDYLKKIK